MKIKIVSCTKYDMLNFSNKTALGKWLNDEYCKIFYENTKGMSTRYNEVIEEWYGCEDVILFVHDDVVINDVYWKEKLAKGFEEFDILGLAGSKKFALPKVNDKIIGWHTCSSREDWSGGLYHPRQDKTEGINDIYWTDFGKCGQVLTLDGLFLAVNMKKLKENGLRFDEDFEWDFYDLSFCLKAHLAGLKLGTVPIACTHLSHGAGIYKDSYKKAQDVFYNKWKK